MSATHLIACQGCARHVRAREARCPFCGSAIDAELRARPAPRPPATRLSRVALFALGTGAAVVPAACGGSISEEELRIDAGRTSSSGSGPTATSATPTTIATITPTTASATSGIESVSTSNFAVPYGVPATTSSEPTSASTRESSRHHSSRVDAGRPDAHVPPPDAHVAPRDAHVGPPKRDAEARDARAHDAEGPAPDAEAHDARLADATPVDATPTDATLRDARGSDAEAFDSGDDAASQVAYQAYNGIQAYGCSPSSCYDGDQGQQGGSPGSQGEASQGTSGQEGGQSGEQGGSEGPTQGVTDAGHAHVKRRPAWNKLLRLLARLPVK